MLTKDDITILLDFLDRVPVTGHIERNNMNIIVGKLTVMVKPEKNRGQINNENS